jgi:hypothetical protein
MYKKLALLILSLGAVGGAQAGAFFHKDYIVALMGAHPCKPHRRLIRQAQ